jgi:hypothetical protein
MILLVTNKSIVHYNPYSPVSINFIISYTRSQETQEFLADPEFILRSMLKHSTYCILPSILL